MDVKLGNLQEKLNNFKDEIQDRMTNFESLVTDIKKETSWRIPDLEKLMQTRISESKVNTMVSQLEKDMMANMKQQDDRLIERLMSSFKEMN